MNNLTIETIQTERQRENCDRMVEFLWVIGKYQGLWGVNVNADVWSLRCSLTGSVGFEYRLYHLLAVSLDLWDAVFSN